MTWVKHADDFYDHPKFLNLELAAVGLWSIGNAYCNRHLTDGFVPRKVIHRLGYSDDVDLVAASLVDAGLWITCDGGWLIHDYLDYQPSADQVKQRRKERSESGRKGARARWGDTESLRTDGSSHGNSHSNSNGKRNGSLNAPVPSRPVSISQSSTEVQQGHPNGVRDDDDRSKAGRAKDAVRFLAAQDLAARSEANTNGRHLHPVADTSRWLDTATQRRWDTHGALAVQLAETNPDWTPTQIAEALDKPAAPTASPVQRFTCPGCGWQGAGTICLVCGPKAEP